MCPHPTNPHRLPQPHLLLEWQPSQDLVAADHQAQPTDTPGKASISEQSPGAFGEIALPPQLPLNWDNRHRRPSDTIAPGRQRDSAEASLGGEQTTPSRTARKPHPFGSLLSPRRPCPAEPHRAASHTSPGAFGEIALPPELPLNWDNRHRRPSDTIAPGRQRDSAEASLGGEQTTPSRTARKPHPFGSLLSPRRPCPAEPHRAASPFKPDLSPQKANQTITPHRLFEKRTSRRTNPWTAIV